MCGLGAQRKVIHQEEGQQALLVPDSHHSAQEMETSPFLGLKKAEERTLASFKFLQLLCTQGDKELPMPSRELGLFMGGSVFSFFRELEGFLCVPPPAS